MSDYDKICEVEAMINNQHNIISERIRQIENRIAAIKIDQESIITTMDQISRTIDLFFPMRA